MKRLRKAPSLARSKVSRQAKLNSTLFFLGLFVLRLKKKEHIEKWSHSKYVRRGNENYNDSSDSEIHAFGLLVARVVYSLLPYMLLLLLLLLYSFVLSRLTLEHCFYSQKFELQTESYFEGANFFPDTLNSQLFVFIRKSSVH